MSDPNPSTQPSEIAPAEVAMLVDTAKLAARIGGAVLMHWRGKFTTRVKGPSDLVTDADLASQSAIRHVIQESFPAHAFIGEELGEKPPAEAAAGLAPGQVCWVVDPLDGTTNYVHGFPCFGPSVAAVRDGRVVAGAVFDPVAGEMFSAGLGAGAFLNEAPIAVSQARTLEESLAAVSLPAEVLEESPDLKDFIRIAPQVRALRRIGSAALNLAYVACGRLDAHWARQTYPWDAAAGVLLVSEAGGVVTGARGGPFHVWDGDYLAAATEDLHQSVSGRLTP
ncbi:inositol monophosphatase family protein [Pseudobythopirellula maris]|uniref:inositol monophosphatase family protein n=1 Tax=Pseudobythopirellula maris TaxID=2527991 RepID=UPI0018D482FA|nr:inositol monophosphatase family protein [Pseudobythopirellula maris]